MYKTRSKRIQRVLEQKVDREIRNRKTRKVKSKTRKVKSKTRKVEPKTNNSVQKHLARLRADFFDKIVLAVLLQEALPSNLPNDIQNEIDRFGGSAQWITRCSRKGNLKSKKSIEKDSHVSSYNHRRINQRFLHYSEVHSAFIQKRLPLVPDWIIRELIFNGVKKWLNKYEPKKLKKQAESYQQRDTNPNIKTEKHFRKVHTDERIEPIVVYKRKSKRKKDNEKIL